MIERPRLRSLDVFRGASIAGMILVNSQIGEDSFLPFAHAEWNGWTFADTIYPAFLFIIGFSLTLSTAARLARGESRASLVWHALRRSLFLYASGVFIDLLIFPSRGFPYFSFRDYVQLTGALEQIAFCYLVAFLIFLWSGARGTVVAIVALNLVYLGLLFFYPVPGCGAGVLTETCSFPAFANELLLKGHLWGPTYDPNGLGSVLPTISSVLFGVLAGLIWRRYSSARERLRWLTIGGAVLVAGGWGLGFLVPLNKHLWTPSYAVFMAGLASLGLAACYAVVDLWSGSQWFKLFDVLGRNAVIAYLFSRPADHALRVHALGWSIPDFFHRVAGGPLGSLSFSIVVLLTVQVLAWLLYREGWFVRF